MSEFSREPIQNVEVEWRTTLAELKGLIAIAPEGVDEDRVEEIRQAVRDAYVELTDRNGTLSQTTAEKIDNLYRSFKRDFLK